MKKLQSLRDSLTRIAASRNTTHTIALAFAIGMLDLVLHANEMGDPRAGLELMGTLAAGSTAAYRYAQQTLQNILHETSPIKANDNL